MILRAEVRQQAALRQAESGSEPRRRLLVGAGCPSPHVRPGIQTNRISFLVPLLRLARSARTVAPFASYLDPLLSHTEIVSWGPERQRPR